MKENKGVTLIALIITIIVLLLLAGVAIATITGQNGVIENANKAVSLAKQDEAKDQEIIDKVDEMFKKYIKKEESIDWEQIKNNATKPAEQTNSENIGLDQYGEPVNMDNWDVVYKSDTCWLGLIGPSGYLGEFNSEGKIEGNVPQWIKNSEVGKWYEVEYVCLGEETELKVAPELPPSITNMSYTFYGCSSLTEAPEIPSSVTDMNHTFYGCSSLTTAPKIPSSVTDMRGTFHECSSLTIAPKIPSSVTDMAGTFYGCSSLTIAPKISSSVTDMADTFYGCSNLTTVPSEIPASVTNMISTFCGCRSLTGEIKILATSLENYTSTFGLASENEGTNLVVKVKTQDILDKLKSTIFGTEHITFELITEE